MGFKTIAALILTVLLTMVIMQNTDEVKFTLLFADVYLPKVVMLTAVAVAAFILGVIVARPKRAKYVEASGENEYRLKDDRNTLSDEDKDYIS